MGKARNNKQDRSKVKESRGATRAAVIENKEPIKWGRYFLLSLCLGLFAYGATLVNWTGVADKAYNVTHRPLANVRIESEFKFVTQSELQSLISDQLDGSFVDLDLAGVKSSIELNSWIKEVAIERIWPDSLKLKVIEHTPIARWNDDGFISGEGQLIKVESNAALGGLPMLSGQDQQSRELAKNYQVFKALLKNSGLIVSGLKVDEKMSWEIQLESGISLVLGQDNIEERLENFKYVYDAYLVNKKQKISRVDMRYEQGLAVQWKDDDSNLALAGSTQ